MRIAIVGASGAVGQELIKCLEQRNFPVDELLLFGSQRSAGSKYLFRGKEVEVKLLQHNDDFKGVDFAFVSAGAGTSREFAGTITKHGAVMIDNSSAFRMDEDVPLVVPECNAADAHNRPRGIIANPNCSTIQAVVALKPLQDKYGIKRVVYSTYQAVAGSGLKGINDLKNGIEGNDEPLQAYAHQIAYNCLPHIDVFLENGYSKEEMKMVNETHKILHDDNIGVTATTVRVPVYYGHSESINIELEKPFELEDIFELFRNAPGIVLQDDLENNVYPLATEAAGTDPVYVGRIRRDFSVENGINLWCVADNVRKGAATNAIQIAEKLLEVLPD